MSEVKKEVAEIKNEGPKVYKRRRPVMDDMPKAKVQAVSQLDDLLSKMDRGGDRTLSSSSRLRKDSSLDDLLSNYSQPTEPPAITEKDVIWEGKVSMPSSPSFKTSCFLVSGPIQSWTTFLPSTFFLTGRIQPIKANPYIQSSTLTRTIIIVQLTSCSTLFSHLVMYILL